MFEFGLTLHKDCVVVVVVVSKAYQFIGALMLSTFLVIGTTEIQNSPKLFSFYASS